MTPAIFIRTYERDFEWLTYCLRSLAVHAPEVQTLVVAPTFQGFSAPPRDNLQFRFTAEHHPDGYVDQQISKLLADVWIKRLVSDATHIVHLDSDTVLLDNLSSLFKDGKPLMLRTPYAELCAEAQGWKAPTEKHLGFPVSHEYMRRFPLTYPIGHYARLRAHLGARHGSFQQWVQSIEGRRLSEFNLLGAFAWEHARDEFVWVDTDTQELPPLIVKQHWSWGGVEKHRAELEKLFP
jgi:hypothetical protein